MPAPAPDLFISYNRVHREPVLAVVEALRARGATTFLDTNDLITGLPWPQAVEENLRRVRAVAVFVGPGGFGEWQRREMYFALERQVAASRQGDRFPVVPVLLPGAELAPAFLFENTWVDFRGGLENQAALDALLAAATKAEVASSPRPRSDTCPYMALRAFREEDAPFFFGRTMAIQATLEKLRDSAITAIVAPSGFGKSSVLLSGVLPVLRRSRPPAPTWDVATFTPGTNVWLGLADALLPLLQQTTEAQRVEEVSALARGLSNEPAQLALVVQRILRSQGSDRLLLGVDQFEELLTHVPEGDREPFLNAIFTAAKVSPLTVVLTLRADFYGVALNTSPALAHVLNSAQVALGPLREEELRTTIEGPARLAGLDFEPGLVDVILDDVRGQKGSLPLLEYAMTALWQSSKDSGRLTHEAYKAIGGVERAISTSAERVFQALSPDDQRAARRLFGRLVRVSPHDEEGTDTRRRATRAEAGEQAWSVAELFAARDHRLLVLSTGPIDTVATVEVAHEAIIRTWDRVRDWLKEDREFLLWRQQLGYLLTPWRVTGALMAPELVPEAARWLSERATDLTEEERTFITRSVRVSGRREQRLAAIVSAALTAVLLAGAGLWGLQRTYAHLAVALGADDRVVVRPGPSWMTALPRVRDRVLLDTGLRRADIREQGIIGLSQLGTNAASGQILQRSVVHDALADTPNAITLQWVLANDAAGRIDVLDRMSKAAVPPTRESQRDWRSVLRQMWIAVARDSSDRLQETLRTKAAFFVLAEAVSLERALGATVAETLMREQLLTSQESARALAYVALAEPRIAPSSAAALLKALESPADAANGGLQEANRADVAGALVITWKAMSAAGASIDPMTVRRSRAADWLLWELEHGTRIEDEDVLGDLLLLEPSLVSTPVTWTARPSIPADIEQVPPSRRSTIHRRLLQLLNPIVPTDDAFERVDKAARILGYAAVARPELAPSIADALVAALYGSGHASTAIGDGLARLFNAQPRLAQGVFPRLAQAISHTDVSVRWQAVGAIAAAVSADPTLAENASLALLPMLTDPATGDTDLTERVSEALGRIVRANPAQAPSLVNSALDLLKVRPVVAGADMFMAALVDVLSPVDARVLAKPLADWMANTAAFRVRTPTASAMAAVMRAAPELCGDVVEILRPGLTETRWSTRAAVALADIAAAETNCIDQAVDLLVFHANSASDTARVDLSRELGRASAFGSRPIDAVTWQRLVDDPSQEVRSAARTMLANTIRRDAARAAAPGEFFVAQLDGRESLLDEVGVNAVKHAAYRDAVIDAIAQWLFVEPQAQSNAHQALAQQLDRIQKSDPRPYLRVAALLALARADELRIEAARRSPE